MTLLKCIRRTARASSVPITACALLMLVTHIRPGPGVTDYPPVENLLPVLMLASVAGLGLAWRWEGLGGAISVNFFLAHLAAFWLIRGEFLPLWVLAILSPVLVTGILFIACWHLSAPEGNPT